jgi:hypothetical protein
MPFLLFKSLQNEGKVRDAMASPGLSRITASVRALGPKILEIMKGDGKLIRRMKAKSNMITGPVIGRAGRIPYNGREEMGDVNRHIHCRKKRLVSVFGFPFRAVFILPILLRQPFAQLAPAAAMHHRFIPVLTQSPGNGLLVGVEIHDNNHLAERLHKQRQQQKDRCTLF